MTQNGPQRIKKETKHNHCRSCNRNRLHQPSVLISSRGGNGVHIYNIVPAASAPTQSIDTCVIRHSRIAVGVDMRERSDANVRMNRLSQPSLLVTNWGTECI